MASEFEGGRSRRRYERVTGPFDGLLEDRVLVYDLNLGGCFINSPHQSPGGTVSILRINLLDEGWITVNAEALYSLQHGFAVRFLDVDSDTAARIERTVATRRDWRR
ncbi:MAG: PilZ domain-containing protein [Cyanobacteria bacterium]|nr:PilZ domain-containing protein [Cyanobacteriota bacterium]